MTEPASDPNANVRAEALRHLKAGRVVLAVGFREKFPVDELGRKLDAWQALRLCERDLPRYFNGQPLNLGILLGEPSGWLVDLDLDTPEARELVARVLPVTATFGRPSSRRSHWLFIAEGAVTTKFLEPDPADLTSQGKPKLHTLLELRSTGMQTVFPPSIHKSGEPIAWEEGPTEPTRIDAAELRRLAGHLAAATLLKRRAPDLLEGYLAAPDVVPQLTPPLYIPVLRRFLGLASPEPARRTTSPAASALFAEALAAYNSEHTRDWGRAGGSCCPVCCGEGGCSCFGRSKHNATRWSCFNTDHPDDCGHKSDDGTYHSGDALDLDAFARGRTPTEHLRTEGYLADRSSASSTTPREEPPMVTDDDEPLELRAARGHLSLVPTGREPGSDDGDETAHPGVTATWHTPGQRSTGDARGAKRGDPQDPDLAKALADIRGRLGAATGRRRLKFTSIAELLAEEDPGIDWLVSGLLPSQGVATASGEPKAAKTWSVLEIGVGVATATPVFGEYVVHAAAPVAIFCAEDDRSSVKRRIRALAKNRGLDITQAPIHVICRETIDLTSAESIADLICAARALPQTPALLILDPLRDLHGADENDSTAMGSVMAMLRAIRDVLGCSVLFVHHVAKSHPDTDGRRPGQRMRGSSAIHGAVDAAVYFCDLKTDGQTYWTSTVTSEIKAARGAGVFGLRLDVDDDEDGGATQARWSIEREATSAAKPKGHQIDAAKDNLDLQAELLAHLRTAEGRPQSITELQARTKKKRERVHAALLDLETARRAARLLKGESQKGWILGAEGAAEVPDGEP